MKTLYFSVSAYLLTFQLNAQDCWTSDSSEMQYSTLAMTQAAAQKLSGADLNEKFRALFAKEGSSEITPYAHPLRLDYTFDYRLAMARKGQIEDLVEAYKLNEEEIAAITGFTHNDGEYVNAKLRAKNETAFRVYEAMLNRALSKIPEYKGPVWVMEPLPMTMVDRLRVGQVVADAGFTDTKTQEPVEIQQRLKYRIKIVSSHGKYVAPVSAFGEQTKEVIFQSGTRFIVKSRTDTSDPKTGDNFTDIVMEEIG